MNADFSKNESIINAPYIWKGFAGWPCYSPDGSKIVFTAEADKLECSLMIVDLNKSNAITKLTDSSLGAKRPTWSPNGKDIAFNLNNESIWTINLESLNSNVYISEINRQDKKLIHPCYAPDGKSILAASYQRGGPQREEVIYRLSSSKKNPIQELTQYPHVCAGRPAVSPCNNKIVFAGHAERFNQIENRLWITHIDKKSTVLEIGSSAECHGRCPAYSHDGKWIACVSTRPLKNPKEETLMSVWIISSDGKDSYQLTDESTKPTHMTWSPDQTNLAVTGAFGLQLIPLPKTFNR